MRAFLLRFEKQMALQRQQREIEQQEQSLPHRITVWFNAQSEIDRQRSYSMEELKQIFNAPANQIGPVLVELGWRRVRNWSGRGNYNRKWKAQTLAEL